MQKRESDSFNHGEHGGFHGEHGGDMIYQELTERIIGCAIKVHSNLGPGLLESSYEECLGYELSKNGLLFERQKPLPLIYEEVKLEIGYRIDILVENQIIIEIKAVEGLNDVHLAQIMTYLKLSGCRVGFLFNFNVKYLKDGIRRVIL